MAKESKLKVAFIDVNFVVNQSKEVHQLRNDQMAKEKELKIWLSTVNTDVMKQGTREEQQQLANKYNAEFAQKQQQLKIDYNQKLQEIDRNITNIIATEAKKLGYDFVFSKGTVLFGGEDITMQIAELVK